MQAFSTELHPFWILPVSDVRESWNDGQLVSADSELFAKSVAPISNRKRGLTPDELAEKRASEPNVTRPVMAGTCICEQDEMCLSVYRSIEFGKTSEFAAWQLEKVAAVEASCTAEQHYTSLAASEWLAADVTLDVDDADEASRTFWNDVDGDHTQYLARTESEGGRWIESRNGDGLATDNWGRDDYTTMIRSREMAKRVELRDALVALGIRPIDAAPWVKARIAVKRHDARVEKAKAEKASMWTEGFPLPSESQIRLRAYASCLAALAKSGPDAIKKTWTPVETTPYRSREKFVGLTPRMRAKLAA